MRWVQALEDSGLRAVFAYGFPWWGKWEERQPNWFVRAATEHFSTKDQMLTLALAAPGPEFTDFEVSRDHWKLARETGARITTHVGVGTYSQDAKVQEMGEAGLLGPDATHIHCTTLNDTEIQMIGDTGGTVSRVARGDDDGSRDAPHPEVPRSGSSAQPQRGRRDQRAQRHVQRDALGAALQPAIASTDGKSPVSTREVLGYATVDGAHANGLESKVGTLTPDKQADVIMLRTDRLNVTPLNDPATAVVAGMDTGNVDTVLISGRAMKRHGDLAHVDWPAVRTMALGSRDYVVHKSGFKLPKI